MCKFLQVDIADINPSVARETFSETELENLANLIIEMGGLIRPAILKKADNKKVGERYDIINGNLEYYASVIANHKVPDIEMINAFVVDKEAENIALEQMQLLSPDKKIIDDPLELRMSNLEKRLETQLQTLREEYQKEIKRLEEKLIVPPPPPPILELLNTCDANQIKKAGITQKVAGNFLKMQKDKPFTSLNDIISRVQGMGEKTLLKLMDYLLTSN
jgi:hypothetical protein